MRLFEFICHDTSTGVGRGFNKFNPYLVDAPRESILEA